MKVVFLAIEAFLARMAPRLLPSLANRIGALTSRAVAATPASILSTIRQFVGANIGKLNMVLTVMAGAGMVFDWDELGKEDPRLAPYTDAFRAITNQALVKLRQENKEARHEFTGNGKEDDPLDSENPIIVGKAAAVLIRRATFATSNLANLEALREVLFMDESKYQMGLASIKR